ncbi:class I SAM-dependent methyltransferase [Oxalobacteraceae bacterium A2-2]
MNTPTLAELYSRNSKHSNYQVLARPLRTLLPQEQLAISSRHEEARLDYLLARVDVRGLRLADVGGNTGFFTLECASAGAAEVLYYEGNPAHAEFVAVAAHALGLQEVVRTEARYLDFQHDFPENIDLCLLLNVLHHIGDDYGDPALTREKARQSVLDTLNHLAGRCRRMAFQLGFNWKGDRHLPLFDSGTKAEMIDFIRTGTAGRWTVEHIGIAARGPGGIAYHELDDNNIARDDSLGEFLNRPFFLLRSLA